MTTLTSGRATSSGVAPSGFKGQRIVPSSRRTTTTGSILSNLTGDKAQQYGITYIPTSTQLTKLTQTDLYELAYGGSALYFNTPAFAKYRQEEEDYLQDVTRSIAVEESIYTCNNCGYNRIHVVPKQISKGDEGQTVFYLCARCQHPWHRR